MLASRVSEFVATLPGFGGGSVYSLKRRHFGFGKLTDG
jgi:hypothetical protein